MIRLAIIDNLYNTVLNKGDCLFLCNRDVKLTYMESWLSIVRTTSKLQDIGVKIRDRILVLSDNSVDFYVLLLAILKIGAIAIPVNEKIPYRKYKHIVEDSKPHFIISVNRNRWSEGKDCLYYSDLKYRDNILSDCMYQIEGNEIALIMYTSGSTGEAKGVVVSHDNILFSSNSIVEYLVLQNDVILDALPQYFDYGLYQCFLAIVSGSTLVVHDNFLFMDELFWLCEKYSVNCWPLVPSVIERIERYVVKNTTCIKILHNITKVTSTGSALFPEYVKKLASIFGNARIFSMYGLTECKRVSYVPPERLFEKINSVGIPMPGVEISIRNDNGMEVKCGEKGYLHVSGRNVTRGYWNDKNLTNQVYYTDAFGKKCINTGDIFYQDMEGYLYFVGRKDDIVKISDMRVSMKSISKILLEIDGIEYAHTIYTKDSNLVSYVVLGDKHLTEQKIKRYLNDQLDSVALIPDIISVDEMPLNDNLKYSRNEMEGSL